MAYETGRDVLVSVLSRGDELGVGLADRETDARRYIQAGVVAVTGDGFPWPWAEAHARLTMTALVELEVGLTLGSPVITFPVPPTESLALRWFRLVPTGTLYRVVMHGAGDATATLDAPFNELQTTGLGRFVQDEYALPGDFLRPIQSPFARPLAHQPALKLHQEDEVRAQYPSAARVGLPDLCALVQSKLLLVAPAPNQAWPYEFDYIRHPTWAYPSHELSFLGDADDRLPFVPAEDGQILEFWALAHLLNDKNDARGGAFAQATVVKLNDMKRFGLKLRKPRRWAGRANSVATIR